MTTTTAIPAADLAPGDLFTDPATGRTSTFVRWGKPDDNTFAFVTTEPKARLGVVSLDPSTFVNLEA